MSSKVKLCVFVAILLWASAFVGIRAALPSFSPEGLALLRYLVAAMCMGLVYYRVPRKTIRSPRDIISILLLGMIGIGVYNLTLNHGELTVSSGMASFIASQTPIISAIIAMLMLNEKLTKLRLMGLAVSVIGMFVMTLSREGGFSWDPNINYLLLATLSGSIFTIGQKSFYQKYHPIEVTAFGVWGGVLFLLPQMAKLHQDLQHASHAAIAIVVYLGIFPGAVAYLAWGYALSKIPVVRASSFLYFMPFLATLLGWLYLGEIVIWQTMLGGMLAIVGVALVNKSYQVNLTRSV